MGMSVPLVMADLTRHVLQDEGMLPASFSMFRPGCHENDMRCLSLVGWLFTVVCTYSGFICLFIGVLWSADMHIKLRKAFAKGKKTKRRS